MWNGVHCLAVKQCKAQFYSSDHSFLYRMSQTHRSGHRRFRLSSKKNAERKKYSLKPSTLPVSIPLSDAVSVFKVSLPIDLLSFNVSIPLEAFLDSPANSLGTLKSRLVAAKAIPPGLSLQFNDHACVMCVCSSTVETLSCFLYFRMA